MDNLKEKIYNILDYINSIEEALQGTAFEDFRLNRALKIKLTEIFEQISSEIKNIPDETKKQYPSIDWDTLLNLTISFLGEYGISEEEIWKTSKHKLKEYRKKFNEILPSLSDIN